MDKDAVAKDSAKDSVAKNPAKDAVTKNPAKDVVGKNPAKNAVVKDLPANFSSARKTFKRMHMPGTPAYHSAVRRRATVFSVREESLKRIIHNCRNSRLELQQIFDSFGIRS